MNLTEVRDILMGNSSEQFLFRGEGYKCILVSKPFLDRLTKLKVTLECLGQDDQHRATIYYLEQSSSTSSYFELPGYFVAVKH